MLNRSYGLKLDLQIPYTNSDMQFMQFDKNTSDFFIRIGRGTEDIDLTDAIVTLVVIKPDNTTDAMFLDIRNNKLYANLKPSMKDIVGTYQARAMLVSNDETVTTDTITYTVNEDKILSQLNSDVVSDERYSILTDLLNRLSTIEINENNRIEAEELRDQQIKELIKEANKAIQNINSTIENEVKKIVSEIVDDVTDEYLGDVKKDLETAVNGANAKIEEMDDKISDVNTFVNEKNNEVNNFIKEANTNIDKAIKSIPPKSELMGQSGADGKSAYDLAVDNGFAGDETSYLESLKGKNGKDGKNAAVEGDISSTGWTKFSNGLILQWGVAIHTPNTFVPIKFPINFPKKCTCFSPQFIYPIGRIVVVDKLTSSGFSFKVEDAGSSGETTWFALGF